MQPVTTLALEHVHVRYAGKNSTNGAGQVYRVREVRSKTDETGPYAGKQSFFLELVMRHEPDRTFIVPASSAQIWLRLPSEEGKPTQWQQIRPTMEGWIEVTPR